MRNRNDRDRERTTHASAILIHLVGRRSAHNAGYAQTAYLLRIGTHIATTTTLITVGTRGG